MILTPRDAMIGYHVRLVQCITHLELQFRRDASASDRSSSAVWPVRVLHPVCQARLRVFHDLGYEAGEAWGANVKALDPGMTTTDIYIMEPVDQGLAEVAINVAIPANQELRVFLTRLTTTRVNVREVELVLIQPEVNEPLRVVGRRFAKTEDV